VLGSGELLVECLLESNTQVIRKPPMTPLFMTTSAGIAGVAFPPAAVPTRRTKCVIV